MKVKNRFLMNYVLVFFITSIIALIVIFLLGILSSHMESTLTKNQYTAYNMMKDDIREIDYEIVLAHNGGIQVVNQNYQVVFSKGIDCFVKKQLTVSEFTEFLLQTQSIDREFSYSIAYNEKEKFWLIVTFPTSIRIDFHVTHNSRYQSADTGTVINTILLIGSIYVLMLIISTFLYSRLAAAAITIPLGKLKESAARLSKGEYAFRASIKGNNEFGELAAAFNSMADQIQKEIELRKQSEDLRRQLTLDLAHDLKNPLAVIMGYAEYCLKNPGKDHETNLNIIYQNSNRANTLINKLFELSKLESPDYKLKLQRSDFCEYLRKKCADMIPSLEEADFRFDFEIPENELMINFDSKEMDRVLDNLVENALKYNSKGTLFRIHLTDRKTYLELIVADNGVGIAKAYAASIFEPFIRMDKARNSESGGSGLGLAIVKKIIKMHQGEITLNSDTDKGCTFTITLQVEDI